MFESPRAHQNPLQAPSLQVLPLRTGSRQRALPSSATLGVTPAQRLKFDSCRTYQNSQSRNHRNIKTETGLANRPGHGLRGLA